MAQRHWAQKRSSGASCRTWRTRTLTRLCVRCTGCTFRGGNCSNGPRPATRRHTRGELPRSLRRDVALHCDRLALAAWLAVVNPQALLFAGPVLASWLAGPLIAWWISRPRRAEPVRLAEPQIRQFRRWARQTWHYFEEMVSQEDHWLPPDNVQEHPHWMVAHRTSPTNIGMGLLADLAAHDLGYVSTAALLERTGRTLHTLDQLERHRGHFFNWYDTRTLQPAEPRYVSSVDSGNLWACFDGVSDGFEGAAPRPLVPHVFSKG